LLSWLDWIVTCSGRRLLVQTSRLELPRVELCITTTLFGTRKPGWRHMEIQVNSFLRVDNMSVTKLSLLGFLRHVAVAKHMGLVLLRLVDSIVVPLNVSL
jgi:hypothetical protein